MKGCPNCGTEFVVVREAADPRTCGYCRRPISPFFMENIRTHADHIYLPVPESVSFVCPKCQPEYPGLKTAS